MKVSFEGIGERVATFYNSAVNAAAAGKAVKIAANDTVSLCADGDKLAGFCIDADEYTATVKTAGFVTAAYTGTAPTLGFCALCADAAGGVKAGSGREYLVIEVDTAAKTVGFII